MDDRCRCFSLWALVVTAIASLSAGVEARTPSDPYDGRWHFHLMPYLWLPNANGSIDTTVGGLPGPAGGQPVSVDVSAKVDPGDYLSNLQAAIMLIGEARRGDWSLFTDVMYVDFGDQDARLRSITGPLGEVSATLSREAKIDLSSVVWTLGTGYTLMRGHSGTLDLIAGARYLSLESDLTLRLEDGRGQLLRSQKVSSDESQWDGIVGVRGQILFPETRWFLPYYADVGTGSSNWTWQVFAGLGYRLDWGEVTLALRSLSYDFDDKDADIRFTGPGLGVGFRW